MERIYNGKMDMQGNVIYYEDIARNWHSARQSAYTARVKKQEAVAASSGGISLAGGVTLALVFFLCIVSGLMGYGQIIGKMLWFGLLIFLLTEGMES